MPVRIGVVSDTHVGDVLPSLPSEVLTALAGVDMVIHAGDVVSGGTLRELEELAPVVAVQGNHDRKAGLALPSAAIVRVGEWLIGAAHGHRRAAREAPAALLSLARGRVVTLGLESHLARRLGRPDCVVFGHLHFPVMRMVGPTLVFSPGAVSAMAGEGELSPYSLRERLGVWFRARLPDVANQPAVGILEIDRLGLRARRVALERPLRPNVPERRGHRPDRPLEMAVSRPVPSAAHG